METLRLIALVSGVPAGKSVSNGYPRGICTAPSGEGTYTLYQKVKDGFHDGWVWRKEVGKVDESITTYEEVKV